MDLKDPTEGCLKQIEEFKEITMKISPPKEKQIYYDIERDAWIVSHLIILSEGLSITGFLTEEKPTNTNLIFEYNTIFGGIKDEVLPLVAIQYNSKLTSKIKNIWKLTKYILSIKTNGGEK
jgi:hypothetical protein